jgi:hypothetical protein
MADGKLTLLLKRWIFGTDSTRFQTPYPGVSKHYSFIARSIMLTIIAEKSSGYSAVSICCPRNRRAFGADSGKWTGGRLRLLPQYLRANKV